MNNKTMTKIKAKNKEHYKNHDKNSPEEKELNQIIKKTRQLMKPINTYIKRTQKTNPKKAKTILEGTTFAFIMTHTNTLQETQTLLNKLTKTTKKMKEEFKE